MSERVQWIALFWFYITNNAAWIVVYCSLLIVSFVLVFVDLIVYSKHSISWFWAITCTSECSQIHETTWSATKFFSVQDEHVIHLQLSLLCCLMWCCVHLAYLIMTVLYSALCVLCIVDGPGITDLVAFIYHALHILGWHSHIPCSIFHIRQAW